MQPIDIDFAQATDDAAIRALLRREPMPGRVRIAFEREPEFARGCAVTGDDYRVLVAKTAQDDVVGVACRSTRTVYLNGTPRRIGYLGQLRVDERFRGRWLVSRGFALLAELDRRDPVDAYLLSIVEENEEAAQILVHKRRRAFPFAAPVADVCTLAIPVGRGPASAPPRADLGEVAEFLQTYGPQRNLFTVWTEERLRRLADFGLTDRDFCVVRRNGAVAAVAALWDQSSFKQSVVRGYSGWLRGVAWLGLPRPGQPLRSAYASMICVADDDRDAFAELLRELYLRAGARGVAYLLAGFDARDPLLPLARDRRHYVYRSRFYLASWSNGGSLHELLDQRPVHADIATL